MPKATGPTRLVWRTSPASDSLRTPSMNGSPVPCLDALDLKGDKSAFSDGVHSRTQPGCACTSTSGFRELAREKLGRDRQLAGGGRGHL